MQSRLGSLIESCLNIGSGFILAMLTWTYIIAPLYGFTSGFVTNLQITSIYTVVSVIHSYFWRRYFNWRYIKRSNQ